MKPDSSIDVVLVTNLRFWERGRGSHNRIDDLVRFLSHQYTLTVFAPTSAPGSTIASYLASRTAPDFVQDRFGVLSKSSVWRASSGVIHRVRRRLLRGPKPIDDVHAADKAAFLQMLRATKPKAVIFEYLSLTPLAFAMRADEEFAGVYRIVDTHDVQHLRARDFAAAGVPLPDPMSEEEEIRRLRAYDAILAITEDDARSLRAMAPSARVLTTSHPVRPRVSSTTGARHDEVIVRYVASGSPNRVSLPIFLEEAWPIAMLHATSDLRLELVGATGTHGAVDRDESVRLIGRTETIEELFTPADIVVNPIVCGSGLKIKNLEALSFGKPLITTPAGAQGMPERTSTDAFIVANDSEKLGAAIARLANDEALRRKMSEAALEYVRRHFSEDVAYGQLADYLASISQRPGPS